MKLVHAFPYASRPCDWPEDWWALTYLVEDGRDEVLLVEYQDALFVRPMAPWHPQAVRRFYQSHHDFLRRQGGASDSLSKGDSRP